ncbi:MAG: D-Ala-D-Ala carboxypeptidase family metallohydrolase [Oculatellaceae cyanobacterium bins.114]|nr:D-Ala-D-Ala carboxypeptidase family metallohydrolase [Oculatellaceae cyanobacterium bins.114]
MVQVLEILQDTVFKRRPLQSTALSQEELVTIPKGKKLELQSYAYADANGDDFDDHIKFAIKNASDYINGLTTWFVYELHAQVLQDGTVVYPHEETESAQKLKILKDTVFKRRPVATTALAANETAPVKAGTIFDLQSYAYADANGQEFDDHIKFAIGDPKQYINGITTWFVFEKDIQVLLDGEVVYPDETPSAVPQTLPSKSSTPTPTPAPGGKSVTIPGISQPVFLNQPIIVGGSFTWAEATKNGTRLPKSQKITDNIVALAKAAEVARQKIGRPFQITSWYRPPEVNSKTPGAAQNSQHTYGKAMDFKVSGMTPREVQKILSGWVGGLGTYPRGKGGWNHIDIGPPGRRWVG